VGLFIKRTAMINGTKSKSSMHSSLAIELYLNEKTIFFTNKDK